MSIPMSILICIFKHFFHFWSHIAFDFVISLDRKLEKESMSVLIGKCDLIKRCEYMSDSYSQSNRNTFAKTYSYSNFEAMLITRQICMSSVAMGWAEGTDSAGHRGPRYLHNDNSQELRIALIKHQTPEEQNTDPALNHCHCCQCVVCLFSR